MAHVPATAAHEGDDLRAAKEAVVDLDRRLSREGIHRKRLESRLDAAILSQLQADRARQEVVQECEDLRRELVGTQGDRVRWLELRDNASAAPDPQARWSFMLGRAIQVPQLKALVERVGGSFLHHNGGNEHSMTLLAGMIGRADCTAFPIDCISHDAVRTVKRQCRLSGKPFVPLRTSSLTCLMGGLTALVRTPEPKVGAE